MQISGSKPRFCLSFNFKKVTASAFTIPGHRGHPVKNLKMDIICKGCDQIKPIENKDTGLCASCNRKARKDENSDLYPEIRRRYLAMCIRTGQTCPYDGSEITMDSDIHHMKGRVGFASQDKKEAGISLLIDVEYFLAVNRPGHTWIEDHPKEAKLKKWSLTRMDVILK